MFDCRRVEGGSAGGGVGGVDGGGVGISRRGELAGRTRSERVVERERGREEGCWIATTIPSSTAKNTSIPSNKNNNNNNTNTIGSCRNWTFLRKQNKQTKQERKKSETNLHKR